MNKWLNKKSTTQSSADTKETKTINSEQSFI